MAALPTPPLNFDPQPALQQEAARFQNTPGFSDIVQLLQSLQHDQQRQIDELPRVTEELSRQFKRFTQDTMIEFSHIRASLNRIPVQLYNIAASAEAPLRYPANIVPRDPLPKTKNELGNLSVEDCNATIAHLGLPPINTGASIAQRRQVIMNYLGI